MKDVQEYAGPEDPDSGGLGLPSIPAPQDPPPTRGERASWALFDFANSAFPTVIVTFVYATYFQNVLVGDEVRGSSLWGASMMVCGLVVAVTAPVVGSLGDQVRGRRMRITFALTAVTVLCTVLLAWPSAVPGLGHAEEGVIWLAWILVTVANTSFEQMFALYNSFLPGLGDKETVGRLSGIGWACGYVGGLLCLALSLGMVGIGESEPWVTTEGDWNVRSTCLLVAAWFVLFSVPFFTKVRERGGHAPDPTREVGLLAGLKELGRTLRKLRDYPDLLRLLIARLFYNDALIAIFGLAALYMTGTLGMSIGDAMLVGIWLNVVSAAGAWGFGYLDDKLGGKAAILLSVAIILVGTAMAILLPTPTWFWVSSSIAGIGLGPAQSSSRSLMARFVSPRRSGEFYGLFALTGKATTWVGPGLFTLVVGLTGSQRLGLVPLVVMLAVGFVLALGIDERRGIALAEAEG